MNCSRAGLRGYLARIWLGTTLLQSDYNTGMSRKEDGNGRWSRRELMQQVALPMVCLPWSSFGSPSLLQPLQKQNPKAAPGQSVFSPIDDALLEDLERTNFKYF
jgi:hypothetical protein